VCLASIWFGVGTCAEGIHVPAWELLLVLVVASVATLTTWMALVEKMNGVRSQGRAEGMERAGELLTRTEKLLERNRINIQ
jgi:hypothetical protein